MDNNNFLSNQLKTFIDLNNKNILPSPILLLTNDVNRSIFFTKSLSVNLLVSNIQVSG